MVLFGDFERCHVVNSRLNTEMAHAILFIGSEYGDRLQNISLEG